MITPERETGIAQLRKLAEAATRGTWTHGRTLMTAQTSRWTTEQFERNEASERQRVFANFSPADEGRSRFQICNEASAEDAAYIAAASPSVILALLDRVEKAEGKR